jgi:hypothetical protein
VLLENQKLHVGNMPALQRIGVATDLVAYAARCIPVANREFDIYSIWFFALDVIQVCFSRGDEPSKWLLMHKIRIKGGYDQRKQTRAASCSTAT